jgi:hypothetical protein
VWSRHRRRGFVAAVLGALAVSVFAAPAASAQTPSMRVSMFGDSVLLGARDQLLARFADQQASVDAQEDRSLLGAVSIFRAAGPALGDVVVLDFGYNDSTDPAVFRGRIDDAMSALANVKHVIWLNQHDWGGRAAMNAELAAAPSRYPNLEVIDWNAEVDAHPEYVYGDSIHLTPAGQTAMATLVRSHFDGYVSSLTPTTTVPATTAAPATNAAPDVVRQPHPARGASRTRTDSGGDTRDLAEVLGVAVLVLVLATVAIVGARRRPTQRRASSSARRASGAVTGSRQANRSHT